MASTDGTPSQSMPTGSHPSILPKLIEEPRRWRFDGDIIAKTPVVDPLCSPPKVIRYVGYRSCLKCERPFWTEAVGRIRCCSYCGGAGLPPVPGSSNNQSDDDDF